MRTTLIFTLALMSSAVTAQTSVDIWSPLRLMIGSWEATAKGQPGEGTVARSYVLVLKDKFIEERNVSTYPPQEKNKKGEIHEHRSFFSYDKQRKTFVLRQFHQEGFVNTYAYNPDASTPTRLVFESEHFENFDKTWKGKETYEIVSEDEFVETFELAPPGKPFEVYSRSRFKRVK